VTQQFSDAPDGVHPPVSVPPISQRARQGPDGANLSVLDGSIRS